MQNVVLIAVVGWRTRLITVFAVVGCKHSIINSYASFHAFVSWTYHAFITSSCIIASICTSAHIYMILLHIVSPLDTFSKICVALVSKTFMFVSCDNSWTSVAYKTILSYNISQFPCVWLLPGACVCIIVYSHKWVLPAFRCQLTCVRTVVFSSLITVRTFRNALEVAILLCTG